MELCPICYGATMLITTGSMRFSAGDVDDDIEDKLICNSCGITVLKGVVEEEPQTYTMGDFIVALIILGGINGKENQRNGVWRIRQTPIHGLAQIQRQAAMPEVLSSALEIR